MNLDLRHHIDVTAHPLDGFTPCVRLGPHVAKGKTWATLDWNSIDTWSRGLPDQSIVLIDDIYGGWADVNQGRVAAQVAGLCERVRERAKDEGKRVRVGVFGMAPRREAKSWIYDSPNPKTQEANERAREMHRDQTRQEWSMLAGRVDLLAINLYAAQPTLSPAGLAQYAAYHLSLALDHATVPVVATLWTRRARTGMNGELLPMECWQAMIGAVRGLRLARKMSGVQPPIGFGLFHPASRIPSVEDREHWDHLVKAAL